MDDSDQSKSEQATPFRLQKAREKGSVARGTDLGFLTGLAAFSAYVWFIGPSLRGQILHAAKSALVAAPSVLASPNEILAVTGQVLTSAARPLIWMGVAIFLVVLVFELIQTGVVFTTQPLRPDFSRLNPAKGLKRVFSVRLLIETGKSVLKLMAYVGVAFLVIRTAQTVVLPTVSDARSLADAMGRTGFRMLTLFVATAVFFALLDQFISRRDFSKKMRMSRRDVRREARDREGEPRMKQRRKQLHREFVKLSESLRNIKGADVLITNPTHYAVALKYDPRTMVAPTVVSQGSHQFALRLRRLAFLYGVVIVESPVLARGLYRCALNREVPEAYYRAVANIYTDIRNRRQSQKIGAPNVQ
jgi:flagellar biosynthetic protein FlhB